MKTLLVLAIMALSITAAVSAQAQTASAPLRGDFAFHQAATLSHLDQHMAAISAIRSCVANAATKAALKVCHNQHRAAMRANRALT